MNEIQMQIRVPKYRADPSLLVDINDTVAIRPLSAVLRTSGVSVIKTSIPVDFAIRINPFIEVPGNNGLHDSFTSFFFAPVGLPRDRRSSRLSKMSLDLFHAGSCVEIRLSINSCNVDISFSTIDYLEFRITPNGCNRGEEHKTPKLHMPPNYQ